MPLTVREAQLTTRKPGYLWWYIGVLLLTASTIFILGASRVQALTSNELSFQGKIVSKVDGTNISPSCVLPGADTCDFRVSIYSDSTGGTALWREIHTDVEIGDSNGVFSLSIGSYCITNQGGSWGVDGDGAGTRCEVSGSGVEWGADDTLYIEVELDETNTVGENAFTTSEVFTRKLLNSVPYSLYSGDADQLDGRDSEEYQQIRRDYWSDFPADTPATVAAGGALAYTGDDYIYALRGGSTEFWRYSITNNEWVTTLAVLPGASGSGSELIYTGGDYIYALRGGNTTDLYRYSISGDTWSSMTASSTSIGIGGNAVYDGEDSIYVIYGGNATSNTGFGRYEIGSNTWDNTLSISGILPSDDGSSMVYTGGDDIYFLSVSSTGSEEIHRYSISEGTWNLEHTLSQSIGYGSNMEYAGGDYIYITGGSDTFLYYRYSIGSKSIRGISNVLNSISYGSDTVYVGDGYIYTLEGITNKFTRYEGASDIGQNVGSGVGGSFVEFMPNSAQLTGNTVNSLIHINEDGTGTPNLMELEVGGVDKFLIDNNGQLQISSDVVSGYEWTNKLGSTSNDEGRGISVDSSGNVYTTGYFQSTVDFDPGVGVDNRTSAGGNDIFVTKYDSSGNYEWANTVGGMGFDYGYGISIDSGGNVYTTGYFQGTVDFDPGAGVDNKTSAGGYDIFVTKYDSSGNYQWTNTVGGTSSDFGYGISVDSSGNVYTTGTFAGTVDFDPGAGVDNKTSAGGTDIFVTKYDSSGNYQWTNTVGGTSYDYGYVISVDSSGNVYTTGYFQGTVDFDPGAGVDNHTSVGSYDIFVTKYDSSGNYQWTNTVGGTSSDYGYGISIDSSGNVYTTGYFQGTVDFDPGAGVDNRTSAGSVDIFVTKYDSSGNYQWTNTVGGTISDIGYGIDVDSSGNVYTTGYFQGTVDFDPGAGVDNHTSVGSSDIFVTKYDSSGNYQWTNTVGGTSYDYGLGISVDSSGNVYIAGQFQGTVDFDPGAGVDNKTSAGITDIFVTKYSQSSLGGIVLGGDVELFRSGADVLTVGASILPGTDDVFDLGSSTNRWRDLYLGPSSLHIGVDGDEAVLGYDNVNDRFQVDLNGDSVGEFVILDNGNVGINNINPQEALDVNGNIQLNGDIITDQSIINTSLYSSTDIIGGASDDEASGIASDSNNNIYIVGDFTGTVDFDPGTGIDNYTSAGAEDIFVTKLNSTGGYEWTNVIGGTSSDYGNGIAVTNSGEVYVTGYFQGTVDFDPGVSVDNRTSVGNDDVFVTKYDSNGNYQWTNTVGGTSLDRGIGIGLDNNSSNVYITGVFYGLVDFDPGAGTDNKTSNGSADVFVTKYNTSGGYLWTNTIGATAYYDQSFGIAVDINDNVYTVGEFYGTVDFDPGAGVDNQTSSGFRDAFLTKYDSSGGYLWTNIVGSTSDDMGNSVVTDSAGNVYFSGLFQLTVDFDPSVATNTRASNGAHDVFVAKYDDSGSYLWVNSFGGLGSEMVNSIVADNADNVYLTGRFASPVNPVDFDPGPGIDNRTSNGFWDVYLTSYSSSGDYQWTNTVGSTTNSEQGNGIVVDNDDLVYAVGVFSNPVDFDPGTGTDNRTSAGSNDIFITKYSQSYTGSNIGTETNPFANIYAGEFHGKVLNISNFDLAEEYEVEDPTIGPGDVVRLKNDGESKLVVERAGGPSTSSGLTDLETLGGTYDNGVIGVISTEPGLYLKDWEENKENGRPVALAGRVPVKVSTENGEIKRGDYLTASSIPGYAMKATEGGFIIGRAMEDFPIVNKSSDSVVDSPMVEEGLKQVKEEVEKLVEEAKESGELDLSGANEILEKVEEETGEVKEISVASTNMEQVEEVSKGRIMMYVDLGYVGEEVYNSNVLGMASYNIERFELGSGENLFKLIDKEVGNSVLGINGDLEVEGRIEASRYVGREGFLVELAEAGSKFRVENVRGEEVLSISEEGKINLREGEGSSIGRVEIAAGETEVYVEHAGVSQDSLIFLEANKPVGSKIKNIDQGNGFTIEIKSVMETNVTVDYWIIN